VKDLEALPGWEEAWQTRAKKRAAQHPELTVYSEKPTVVTPAGAELTSTPAERIDRAFTELRETLIADLLNQLSRIDPFRFEQVVLDLLVAMGYGGSRKEAAAVT
jgi:restriction endonuclease Mrr